MINYHTERTLHLDCMNYSQLSQYCIKQVIENVFDTSLIEYQEHVFRVSVDNMIDKEISDKILLIESALSRLLKEKKSFAGKVLVHDGKEKDIVFTRAPIKPLSSFFKATRKGKS